MVTLTITCTRVADVLRRSSVSLGDWDPQRHGLAAVIDKAAGYIPGVSDTSSEELAERAWDAVVAQLLAVDGVHEHEISHWEARPFRVRADLNRALLAAAREVDGR